MHTNEIITEAETLLEQHDIDMITETAAEGENAWSNPMTTNELFDHLEGILGE